MVRDYIYIEDGVDAYLKLAENMESKELFGEAINFSSEKPMNVLEVVGKILRAMGSNLKPMVLNQVSNEIPEQYLSAQKAKDKLNWEPLFGIDEGLTKTVGWYKEYFLSQKVF